MSEPEIAAAQLDTSAVNTGAEAAAFIASHAHALILLARRYSLSQTDYLLEMARFQALEDVKAQQRLEQSRSDRR